MSAKHQGKHLQLCPGPGLRKPGRECIDYAGPLEGKMFLLIKDAYSRWLEIHITNTSTSTATIELLRKSFASLGLPEVLVSNNAAVFTSEEFTEFSSREDTTLPPSVEWTGVQTFKEGLKCIKSASLNTRVSIFLLSYRTTPHSSTGSTPSELLMRRRLRTQLDLLRPNLGAGSSEAETRCTCPADTVFSWRYRNYGPGCRWLAGMV